MSACRGISILHLTKGFPTYKTDPLFKIHYLGKIWKSLNGLNKTNFLCIWRPFTFAMDLQVIKMGPSQFIATIQKKSLPPRYWVKVMPAEELLPTSLLSLPTSCFLSSFINSCFDEFKISAPLLYRRVFANAPIDWAVTCLKSYYSQKMKGFLQSFECLYDLDFPSYMFVNLR